MKAFTPWSLPFVISLAYNTQWLAVLPRPPGQNLVADKLGVLITYSFVAGS